jgi:hypothetical protein
LPMTVARYSISHLKSASQTHRYTALPSQSTEAIRDPPIPNCQL